MSRLSAIRDHQSEKTNAEEINFKGDEVKKNNLSRWNI